ncbi:MAG: hypothetical protein CMI86_03040 [Candidatus Pelagibacter sp.]|nr:hypothetical protein [Candidatus Pelagibacter sp.]|tara:strand:+ start:2943 stop:3203 length:261 start_codon:yes stop_codon:yes gene_type:complete
MIKEIKYLFFVFVIFFSLLFILKYYFSEKNKIITNKVVNQVKTNVKFNEDKLILLENDSENIIEYVDNKVEDYENEFKFWELFKIN